MKTNLLLFLGLLLLVQSAQAQNASLRLSIGPNYFPISQHGNNAGFKPNPGFSAGVGIGWKVSTHLSISGMAQLNQMSFKEQTSLIFPADILNSSKTVLETTFRLTDIGGQFLLEWAHFKRMNTEIGMFIGKSFSKMDVGKKSGNGELVKLDKIETPDLVLSPVIGINYVVLARDKVAVSLGLNYSFRTPEIKVESGIYSDKHTIQAHLIALQLRAKFMR